MREASERILRSAQRLARQAALLASGDNPVGRQIMRRELWLLTRRVGKLWWEFWRRRR